MKRGYYLKSKISGMKGQYLVYFKPKSGVSTSLGGKLCKTRAEAYSFKKRFQKKYPEDNWYVGRYK